jgi:gluconolactonase
MLTLRIAAVATVVFSALSAFAQAPASNEGLKTVLAPNAKLEKVASGFRFTEGPLYDRKTNSVLFSDQPASNINRYDCTTGKVTLFRGLDVVPNGNTFDDQGRLIGCEHKTRRISRTDADKRIVTLAYLYDNKRLNSPNDIAIKKDGVIYFTDPPYGLPNGREGKEQDVNGVYRIEKDGKVALLTGELKMPNGLAFSPDEKTLYVGDTEQQIVRAYDVKEDGTLANSRTLADLHYPGHRGAPDGMKVDSKGLIFSTGAGGVWVIAPNGTVLGIIETPETAANCAFGDKDGKSLYITASTGLYRIRLQNAGPVPGKK